MATLSLRSPDGGRIVWDKYMIGSVGTNNGPHYIPDWQDW